MFKEVFSEMEKLVHTIGIRFWVYELTSTSIELLCFQTNFPRFISKRSTSGHSDAFNHEEADAENRDYLRRTLARLGARMLSSTENQGTH